MARLKLWVPVVAVLVAVLLGAATVAAASSEDEGARDDGATEQSITGSDLDRASQAALDHTGSGQVTGTEVGDEESYYEVEVTLDGGGQVDVQLDKDFNVVSSEGDGGAEG